MMKSSPSKLTPVSQVGKSVRDKTRKMANKANDLVTQSRRSNNLSSLSNHQPPVRPDEVRADLSREADDAASDLSRGHEAEDAVSHASSQDVSGVPSYQANPAVANHPLVKKMTAAFTQAMELLDELGQSDQGQSHGFMLTVRPKQALLDELEDCFKASKGLLESARVFQQINPALWDEAWALHRMMEHKFHVEAKAL